MTQQIDYTGEAEGAPENLHAVSPENQSQLLFDEFPDGIAVFTQEGVMLQCNHAFRHLLSGGNDVSELRQRQRGEFRLRDLLLDQKQEEVLISKLADDKVVRLYPLVFKASDGSNIDTEVSAVADLEAGYFAVHVREIRYTKYPGLARVHLSKALEALLPQPIGKGLLEKVSATTEILERYYIERALASVKGNRAAAARKLGLSRQSLYVKLNRYGIGEQAP